jgi:hypothetical protein
MKLWASRSLHQFLLRYQQRVKEGLHRRFAVAPSPLPYSSSSAYQATVFATYLPLPRAFN